MHFRGIIHSVNKVISSDLEVSSIMENISLEKRYVKKIPMVVVNVVLLMSIFSLVSCNSFNTISDDKDADNKLESSVECLTTKDRECIKSLFAQNKIEDLTNFEDSIEELF